MSKNKTKRKVTSGTVLLIAAILIGFRLYFPVWLTGYVNEQIATLDGYGGTIEDVDVHLWRGAYQIHGLDIHKNTGGLEKPFIAAEKIDFSVEWSALLNGAIVTEIDIYEVDFNFSKTQTGKGEGWATLVNHLSPFDINRLDVHSGRLSYTSYTAEPNVHLFIDGIDAQIKNLRNVKDGDKALPSSVKVTGTSIGGGALSLDGGMNILKETPDFDLGLKLENANLKAFNDYARSYAGLDFESGTLGVFSEMAAANGRLTGYVKPVATGVSVVSVKEQGNPFNLLWESLVSVVLELFENQSQDQFAMRIPVEGNLNSPEQEFWIDGFLSIFSNAFGRAFSKNEDGTINFQDALEGD